MTFTSISLLVVISMLAGIFCLMQLGRRFASHRLARDAEAVKEGAGAVDGAVFGLMGLLLAFTFSGAAERFDTRRAQIVEEANCIGTAWLRLDLLPQPAQPPLRDDFRRYLDARIDAFRKLPDMQASQFALDTAAGFQRKIWTASVIATADSGSSSVQMLVLPALNQMFDMAATRTNTAGMHPPVIIHAMLALLVLAGSLLAGYGMGASKKRDWFHMLMFALIMTLAIYVILDFEFPRIGLIRIQQQDRVMVELRESMN